MRQGGRLGVRLGEDQLVADVDEEMNEEERDETESERQLLV